MRDRLPMIFSTAALVVAVLGATPLGEAAYNALAPGSVGTAQLKNNSITAAKMRKGAVTNAKLRGDAVTSGKVKNRSLRAIDFKLGQLPAGPPGPKGAKGDKGDKGEAGPVGISGYQLMNATSASNSNTPKVIAAKCPNGKRAIGGGGSVIDGDRNVAITETEPFNQGEAWEITAWEHTATSSNWSVHVVVICAKLDE